MRMEDPSRDKYSKRLSGMDAFMLILCFIAFAVFGYFLARQILS
ncbi:MAG: hypothetical protein QW734_06950 [Candidatus Bathyarchaeia archaeon]